MNFFEHQHQARIRTRWLVFYFAAAVTLITVALNAVVFSIARFGGHFVGTPQQWLLQPWWLLVTATTLALILGTSFFRMQQLSRGGGQRVAQMVGAKPVDLDTRDPAQRQLINLVEEMSIAAGVSLPALYILEDESGINAFVAGPTARNTVMVVTRGALDQLDRDQMQGVIAHEYSHIYNGDCIINTRLIGALAGILLLGQSGLFLLRSLHFAGSRRRSGGGQAIAIALALGLALCLIGYIGLFFGRLIQSAVSRQREYLADASAVQYTRNPAGIAGALTRIGQTYWGSRLLGKNAEDLSHICFGETRKASLLASHPPLKDRIERIAPGFDLPPKEAAEPRVADHLKQLQEKETIAQQVGQPSPQKLVLAAALLGSIPSPIKKAMRGPQSAKAAVYALVLAHDSDHAEEGLRQIEQAEGYYRRNQVKILLPHIQAGGVQIRLPLIDLAIAPLQRLPQQQIKSFLQTLDRLVELDQRVSVFEYLLRLLLRHQLGQKPQTIVGRETLVKRKGDITVLLSTLIHAGSATADGATIFQQAMQSLKIEDEQLLPKAECVPKTIHTALKHLRRVQAEEKGKLIEAMAVCTLADDKVEPTEVELMRVAAMVLDVPMPPLPTEVPCQKS